MPITLCTSCGRMYDAGSEEEAHAPSMTLGRNASRLCPRCVTDGVTEAVLRNLQFRQPAMADYVRRQLLDRAADDTDDV